VSARRAAEPSGGPGAPGRRPYPVPRQVTDPEGDGVLLAATRALLQARSPAAVEAVLACAVADLGGSLVPAAGAPPGSLPLDLPLGTGEPLAVAVDDVSVAALRLSAALPRLVEDARTALGGLEQHVAPPVVGPPATGALCRLRLHGTGAPLPAGGPAVRELVAAHHRVLAAVRAAWGSCPGAEVRSTTVGEVLAVVPGVPPEQAAEQVRQVLEEAGGGLPWHAGVAPLPADDDRAVQTAGRALVRARSAQVPVVVEGCPVPAG
jgi:hypothetical protein